MNHNIRFNNVYGKVHVMLFKSKDIISIRHMDLDYGDDVIHYNGYIGITKISLRSGDSVYCMYHEFGDDSINDVSISDVLDLLFLGKTKYEIAAVKDLYSTEVGYWDISPDTVNEFFFSMSLSSITSKAHELHRMLNKLNQGAH